MALATLVLAAALLALASKPVTATGGQSTCPEERQVIVKESNEANDEDDVVVVCLAEGAKITTDEVGKLPDLLPGKLDGLGRCGAQGVEGKCYRYKGTVYNNNRPARHGVIYGGVDGGNCGNNLETAHRNKDDSSRTEDIYTWCESLPENLGPTASVADLCRKPSQWDRQWLQICPRYLTPQTPVGAQGTGGDEGKIGPPPCWPNCEPVPEAPVDYTAPGYQRPDPQSDPNPEPEPETEPDTQTQTQSQSEPQTQKSTPNSGTPPPAEAPGSEPSSGTPPPPAEAPQSTPATEGTPSPSSETPGSTSGSDDTTSTDSQDPEPQPETKTPMTREAAAACMADWGCNITPDQMRQAVEADAERRRQESGN